MSTESWLTQRVKHYELLTRKLYSLLDDQSRRITELELIIERLIDAGNELDYPLDDYSEEHNEWRKIIIEWNKEHR
jgi:hypothetical protein